ncbi:MAG: hypothetical protein F4Z86_08750 [Gemmatimonadetes bacterium]|nr:hypothetical protein [Gemmatimonadota bacterium]MYB58729.1 hypothetical protein [Gemmatimonadota bacterium]
MVQILREDHPRLYHPADDPDYRFEPPKDEARKRILKNILADCEIFYFQRPWKRIPERPHSPHPYHQLYLTFYTGMYATALIEHYAFAWCLTGDPRWLKRARDWLRAAGEWEHSDRVEEHFYTANRYMQAFALALDLLGKALPDVEKKQATACLVQMMNRWWPDVERNRYSSDGRHHAVVDNGHFGVAALYLLGKHPDAEAWVSAVIDRFRSGVMPYGCGRDGAPGDGPAFWPWENLWMLHFADALRNVTGEDLYKTFPKRLEQPLTWFRYHLAPPQVIEDRLYYSENSNVISGSQIDACSVTLLRLAQEAGDAEMRDVALGDPRLGRLYRFGMGVKGTTAECMIAYAPYAYCYYDPEFQASSRKIVLPLSRIFTRMHYGEAGLLRSGWDNDAVVCCVSGYKGGSAHGFMNLHVQWAGYPILKTISAEESQPVACGSLPFTGGQNEIVAFLRRLDAAARFERLRVRSIRTDHEYWLLKGTFPILVTALRRRRRGVRVMRDGGEGFVRLNGRDYLQYEREPYFNPKAGELRMRFRLNGESRKEGPEVLFNTGIGVGRVLGSRVNNYSLAIMDGDALTFVVQSQRNTSVEVVSSVKIEPNRWHDAVIRWGGFNRPGDNPFIEIEVDGCRNRCDDRAIFGELGLDSQNLQSRAEPRTFYIKSNTVLAFGGAVQMPGTGVKCDLDRVDLKCPGCRRLLLDFETDLGPETGSGALGWKLNPVDLRRVWAKQTRFGAGGRSINALLLYGEDACFEKEEVPFAPSGLAAGSLVSFVPRARDANTRVQLSTPGDILVFAFVEHEANVQVVQNENGFEIGIEKERYGFNVNTQGEEILTIHSAVTE